MILQYSKSRKYNQNKGFIVFYTFFSQLQEKEDLEESFLASQKQLAESQAYINQLREQQKSEKRERARWVSVWRAGCVWGASTTKERNGRELGE